MKRYINLLCDMLAIARIDVMHIDAQEESPIQIDLDPAEELLVLSNPGGADDLYLLFDEGGATLVFGEWVGYFHGSGLEDFEYLVYVLKRILEGAAVVREMSIGDVEVALLYDEEINTVLNTYIVSGSELLHEMSAFDFFAGMDLLEAYFEEVRWEDDRNEVFPLFEDEDLDDESEISWSHGWHGWGGFDEGEEEEDFVEDEAFVEPDEPEEEDTPEHSDLQA